MNAALLLTAFVLTPFALASLPASARTVTQADNTPTGLVTLAGLKDRARPLLIFAPTPDDSQLEIQLRRLHDAAVDVAERDVAVIAIPYQSPSTTAAMLSPDDAAAARRRFNVAPGDFTVILIGKDGGEKLRSSKPFTIEKLRETIDAMPMRQDEMRQPR